MGDTTIKPADPPSGRSSPAQSSESSSSSSFLAPSELLYKSSKDSGSDNDLKASQQDRSSADIQSAELLADQKRPLSSTVHGHILPSGWVCNYDSDNDQYEFEFKGDQPPEEDEVESGRRRRHHHQAISSSKISTKDEAITAITPSTDEVVQTSRRPTLQFECKYGYHFPTSPTSSMISELAKQVQKNSTTAPIAKTKQVGYGKLKLTVPSDEGEQARRLKDMFPTATEQVVDQMIKIYKGREGLIKAALISFGYKRATEYNSQQSTAQSPIMLMMAKPSSKKLFDKLVSYFPDKDETLIKNLMYKHKEVEHEIISALVESDSGDEDVRGGLARRVVLTKRRTRGGDKNGAIMKLRYLKFLFPTCEEIELFHLLHSYNLNAQKVIEEVERKGHKRADIEEVMKNRKSQTQQMRAQQAALEAKNKAPIVDPIEAHRNRTKPVVTGDRANNLKESLKKRFESPDLHDDNLLLKALEAADYNEPLAKKFLDEMAPIDEALYKQRYQFHREQPPAVVFYPCKGIQKGDTSFMSITSNEYVSIPKEVVECETALALLKVDACTFTQDDFEMPRFSHARGKNLDLAVGSIFNSLEVKESLRRGALSCLRMGTNYKEVCADTKRQTSNQRAIGRDIRLVEGRKLTLRSGHNLKLVQRTHPFFR